MMRFTGMRHGIRAGSGWRMVAIAAVVVVGGVAACSSSSSTTSTTTPTTSAPSTSAPATSASATSSPSVSSLGTSTASAYSGSVTNYQSYVGHSGAANSSLAPVILGWVEEQGGPPNESFPQATAAAEATVNYINKDLGGVDGHPLKLSQCYIAAVEAQGTTCGDQMVNTKGVEAVVEGIDAVGNASMYGVLNGTIPTLVGVSADSADNTGKNVFELEGSGTSATVAFGPFLRSQFPSDKTVAIAYQNIPGAAPISEAIEASAKASGFSVTMIPYSDTATDLVAQATQLEAAQIQVPDCGFVDCPEIAKAMNEIGDTKPAISVPLFNSLPPTAYSTGDLPHWIVGEATANLETQADPGVAAYYKTIEANGLSAADTANAFSGVAFGSLLFATKIMDEIPYASLSPAAVTAKIKSYIGPLPLGPASINCTGTLYPADTNVCSDFDQFYQYEGKGSYKLLEGWTN
jgi:branched-chain amino acid transport system substrate-binding protein